MGYLTFLLIMAVIALSLTVTLLVICLVRHQNALDWMFNEKIISLDDRMGRLEAKCGEGDDPSNGFR